jgi:hypothetical protein
MGLTNGVPCAWYRSARFDAAHRARPRAATFQVLVYLPGAGTN